MMTCIVLIVDVFPSGIKSKLFPVFLIQGSCVCGLDAVCIWPGSRPGEVFESVVLIRSVRLSPFPLGRMSNYNTMMIYEK